MYKVGIFEGRFGGLPVAFGKECPVMERQDYSYKPLYCHRNHTKNRNKPWMKCSKVEAFD